jgi:hypothetical protein
MHGHMNVKYSTFSLLQIAGVCKKKNCALFDSTKTSETDKQNILVGNSRK